MIAEIVLIISVTSDPEDLKTLPHRMAIEGVRISLFIKDGLQTGPLMSYRSSSYTLLTFNTGCTNKLAGPTFMNKAKCFYKNFVSLSANRWWSAT